MSTFDRVCTLLESELGADPENISTETKLIDLSAESLDRAALVIEAENAFGCEIPDDDFQKLFTVGDLVAYMDRRTAQ